MKAVRFLVLTGGARIDAADRDGNTALHRAAYVDALDIATFLIIEGADIEARNGKKEKPIDCAAKGNAVKVQHYFQTLKQAEVRQYQKNAQRKRDERAAEEEANNAQDKKDRRRRVDHAARVDAPARDVSQAATGAIGAGTLQAKKAADADGDGTSPAGLAGLPSQLMRRHMSLRQSFNAGVVQRRTSEGVTVRSSIFSAMQKMAEGGSAAATADGSRDATDVGTPGDDSTVRSPNSSSRSSRGSPGALMRMFRQSLAPRVAAHWPFK